MLDNLERIVMTAVVLVLPCAGAADGREPEETHTWTRPFSADSIWNTPIGSAAEYADAHLPASRYIGCDIEWHIRVSADDPVYPVYSPATWEKRWPGDRKLGELRFPENLVIPDANPPHTPNACAAFLMPDGRTIRQIEPACRVATGQHIVGWLHPEDQDLFGSGIKGTHYGSGLSAIGGSIRKGELVSDQPLRHALKLNVWGRHLYYSQSLPGFRWPADRSDDHAPKNYLGSNPRLVMGSLLAIPRDRKPEHLGVQSAVGLKIFHALQDFGAYVADDAGWDAYDLCVERGVPEEVKHVHGYGLIGDSGPFVDEMKRMIRALMIIDSNGPERIGGGTSHRAPAPALDSL